jgi:hypothetical protein
LESDQDAAHSNNTAVSAIAQAQTDLLPLTPESDRANILKSAHQLGHYGAAAMVRYIKSNSFFWPKLMSDCQDIVNTCTDCQRFNISRQGFHPLRPIFASLPMDHVAIDLLGPMTTSPCGKNYVLVVVDV